METVTCPNCGSEIDVPKTMPVTVTCKGCGETFGVEYDPAEFGFFGKIKIKCNDFSIKHPKIVKAGKVTGMITVIVGGAYLLYKSNENTSPSTNSQISSASDSPIPPDEIGENSYDNYEYDCDEEDDYSLNGCCRTCGASLDDAFYTMPWEDDDNEYGYWTCRKCHAKNIDWDSGDD